MIGNVNDRELLELAAMAYLDKSWHGNEAYMRGFMSTWNPLDDDGYALRLAVELNMSIEIDSFNGDTIVMVNDAVGSPLVIINQRHLGNPCKATRRAIVSAAAEIGRQM